MDATPKLAEGETAAAGEPVAARAGSSSSSSSDEEKRKKAEEEAKKTKTLVDNERYKLTATWLNGLAVAVFAVGVLTPTFAAVNSLGTLNLTVIGSASLCIAASSTLHIVARRLLGGLKS